MKKNKTTVSKSNNVILRKKPKKGGFSLYFDIHTKGRRAKEYLGMHISNASKPTKADLEILEIAERLRLQRIKELIASQYNEPDFAKVDHSLLAFIQQLIDNSGSSVNTLKKTKALIFHLKKYSKFDIRLSEINDKWLEGFRSYLSVKKRSTADRYFTELKTVLNKAKKAKLIISNPMDSVENIGRGKSLPKFLTFEEVVALDKAKCGNEEVKRAFLFTCFSGLRFGDVKSLQWKNIVKSGDKWFIHFSQEKTRFEEHLPLSEMATKYLGERKDPELNVFILPGNNSTNKDIKVWKTRSKIDKTVTFHIARHTFATLALTFGVDLFTVSKLLGHSEIKSTQIYAKVIDKKKEEAVSMLPVI